MSTFGAGRLQAAEGCFVGGDDDNTSGWNGRLNNLSVQLIAAGTIALVATCIRVWAGMDVIQTQIAALSKSDSQQDSRIEQVQEQINTMRVQIGIMRAQLGAGPLGYGKP